MDYINMNPQILVSIINMKLRDFYTSLDELCEDLGLNINELNERLNKASYYYDDTINQYK